MQSPLSVYEDPQGSLSRGVAAETPDPADMMTPKQTIPLTIDIVKNTDNSEIDKKETKSDDDDDNFAREDDDEASAPSEFDSDHDVEDELKSIEEDDDEDNLGGSFQNLKLNADKPKSPLRQMVMKLPSPLKITVPKVPAGIKSKPEESSPLSPVSQDITDSDEGVRVKRLAEATKGSAPMERPRQPLPATPVATTSYVTVKVKDSGTTHRGSESPDGKTSLFSKLASLKRLGDLKWGSGELPRASSLDSILPNKAPPKSILKRPNPVSDNEGEQKPTNAPPSAAETADITDSNAVGESPLMAALGGDPRLGVLRSTGMHSSVPNLTAIDNGTSGGGMKKSGSSKQLIFDLQNVKVMPMHSKTTYNRKPDNNMTFRKLTPQLKDQIRLELNTYKRNEMPIHKDSEKNTVFH